MQAKEKNYYLSELEKSKIALLAILGEVLETEFHQKMAEDTWSISEVVEHIIKVESAIINNVKKLNSGNTNTQKEKGLSNKEVMDKSSSVQVKVKSAPMFIPEGIFQQKEDAITSFKQIRLSTEEFISACKDDLSLLAFPHPRLGMLNGDNWLLFIAGHCIRHTTQIEAILKK